jgi:thiamine-phosphate pyrophosphorylase
MRLDGRRALVCLVTDRRRLARALRAPTSQRIDLLLAQIEGAVAGGVDLVQIREGDLDAARLVALVRESVTLARRAGALVVVNDRADVAIAAGADGVHLREDSFPAEAVRRLAGRDFLIGRSVHGDEGARAAGPVDYLVAGSVFETESKPGAAPSLGLDGLRAIVHAAAARPVLAIGGITAARVHDILSAGARGAAFIGSLLPTSTSSTVSDATMRARDVRFAFDSAQGLT